RAGEGLSEWFGIVEQGEPGSRAAMEVDYELYAEGEALLGWLNATAELKSERPFDPNAKLESLARAIQERLGGTEIAHLKMTLSPRIVWRVPPWPHERRAPHSLLPLPVRAGGAERSEGGRAAPALRIRPVLRCGGRSLRDVRPARSGAGPACGRLLRREDRRLF